MTAWRGMGVALAWALWTAAAPADAAEVRPPKTVMIPGGGGLPIALTQWGNADGREILFVHGFLASTLNWHKQIASDLGQTHDLAAIDLRGHGASAKPATAADYTGTQPWADDIAAAITAAGFSKPLIVAWSYGGFFVMDYIRAYGTANVGGVVIAGGTGGLIAPPPPPAPTPERQKQIERNTSPNLETIIDWTNGYMGFLTADGPLPAAETEMIKISALLVPHYVRPFLREHRTDNSDLAPRLNVPVLFIAGTKDASAKLDDVRAAAKGLKTATVVQYDNMGAMTFWYAPERFNADIAAFAQKALR